MRTPRYILSAFVAIVLLASCKKKNYSDCVTPIGEITTEQRDISAFNKLSITDNIDVEIHIAPDYEVDVIAGKNLQPNLIATVSKDSTLYLDDQTVCRWLHRLNYRPKVSITCPSLNYIHYSGTGTLTALDTIKTPTFHFVLNEGSGSISLPLMADTVSAILYTGFADLSLSGKCQKLVVFTGDATRVKAQNMKSESCFINNGSIASDYVHFDQYLYAEINNRGDIYYSGPSVSVDAAEKGSGKVLPY